MTPLLIEFIASCAAVEADPQTVGEMLEANPEAAAEYGQLMQALQTNSVPTTAGPVYILPMLTADTCKHLVALAKDLTFTPNLTEGRDYQIHEAVLAEVAQELDAQIKAELGRVLNAYSLMLYSRPLVEFSSLQLARYSPEGTPGTGWHHDVTSDLSLVISLNPVDFAGGGTGIRQAASQVVEVPPLPAGWAMLFDGKAIQHRGLPVIFGERLLLVAWCKTGVGNNPPAA